MARRPSGKYAGSPDVKRHHHWLAGLAHLIMVLSPWAVAFSALAYITFHKDRNELEAFCSTAGIVPDRFLCTDIRGCSETSYWNSVASVSMNAQIRAQCGPVTNEVTMTIPYETYAPSEETIAEIKAEIGDIQAWQRDRVIRDAVSEMGGPD
ncbi:MAG: hypothetical protein EP341_03005 [Sphingomonadales bacterium]|nr:MAG: hypothetical protein EP341_03005 [Sphingomonadales bacterium]